MNNSELNLYLLSFKTIDDFIPDKLTINLIASQIQYFQILIGFQCSHYILTAPVRQLILSHYQSRYIATG